MRIDVAALPIQISLKARIPANQSNPLEPKESLQIRRIPADQNLDGGARRPTAHSRRFIRPAEDTATATVGRTKTQSE